ncbi:MAG: cyclic pyranopterin monophosphate synthase MoaC [SAR202 cluster bacterium]|nr:cyclic pyranopterin monophosphate synthase MoaC [Chloroflexota bacterium]MQG51210.1 cyclic pyranopterin monophosphate synthase MoaC [SAR202 cluster bacterium]|tara:strand:- start:564 stop:1442 length:879 start_codon:yes stop_codon:yes gene_type:complete
MIKVYTDGSCLGNPGPGGWGAVIIFPNGEEMELSGSEEDTTNNRMELRSVIEALHFIEPGSIIELFSDSLYVINTITKGWKKKANISLWNELEKVIQKHSNISWNWVKGHSGDFYNEKVNDLAQGKAEMVKKNKLSHISEEGKVQMVDVGQKSDTERIAFAKGFVKVSQQIISQVLNANNPKGDVLSVSRIAGIMAAKRTPELIPLCHQIDLNHVDITIEIDEDNNRFVIEAMAKSNSKTGVEMESLVAVSITALTIYDMTKSIDHDSLISDIQLVSKKGGKSGNIIRETSF